MFRKTLVFTVVVFWLLVGVSTMASAAQFVANTSQKGSLLVFAKIDTRFSTNPINPMQRDTLIRIGNDLPRGVMLKCYWVDSDQEWQDFSFVMTISQPIWFSAKTGIGTTSVPPFFPEDENGTVGELKCWAIDNDGTRQESWNWLYGSATVVDYATQTAYEYNAFVFRAQTANDSTNASLSYVGFTGDGNLKLEGFKPPWYSGAAGDPNNCPPIKTNCTPATCPNCPGTGYDACPSYLLFNFFAQPPQAMVAGLQQNDQVQTWRYGKSDLTLVPCLEDLRQDRVPTCTKAKFDIWNENETKYTGAYQCIKCWFEGFLSEIGNDPKQPGFGGEKFSYNSLHTTMGRMRITGVASQDVCGFAYPTCTSQVASPLLGILSTQVFFESGSKPLDVIVNTGSNGGVFPYVEGFDNIYWDANSQNYSTPVR